jgi:hypothetical protein
MKKRIGSRLMELFIMLALACAAAAVMPRAYADMIPSEAAQASAQREHVKALLQRPEVSRELEKMGVPAANAAERVDAMSDAEVAQLAGRLDQLAAGGAQFSNEQILIVALIVIILVIAL